MNDLGWILLGAAARSSVLAAIGLMAVAAFRRRGPAAGALIASTTLAVLVVVSGLSASPWPRWWSAGGTSAHAGVVASSSAEDAGPPSGTPVPSEPRVNPAPSTAFRPAGFSEFFLEEFRREMAQPGGSPASGRWRWSAWLAAVVLGGWAIGLIRLALGLWAVEALRARSRPVSDRPLLSLAENIRDAIGLRRRVEVRESTEIATPATIGWRRPTILLPPSWAGWGDGERRAVLAHELAHVHRGDYAAGILAQLSLSIHFYHPMVHALAGRLRLQQELAADAWGARLSGGRLPYLTTLANLALRQDPRPAAWPARPFLPTRGTFLRRIEMLRDPNAIQTPSLPRPWRAFTVASLAIAGLALAGLRGPASPGLALGQEPPPTPAERKPTVITGNLDGRRAEPGGFLDPASASSDIHLVVEIRPAELLKDPELKKLAESIPADGLEAVKVLASGEIEQVLLLLPDRGEAGFPGQPAVLLRSARPYDWKPFLPTGVVEVNEGGVTFLRAGSYPGSPRYRMLDDRTLLMGTEADVKLPPIGAGRPAGRHGWDAAWKQGAKGPIRLAFDTPWLARRIRANHPPGPAGAMTAILGPLYEKASAYAITLGLDEGVVLEARLTCDGDESAGRVADTLRAGLTLARNALPDLRRSAEASPPEAARSLVDLVDAFDTLLEAAKIDQENAVVQLHAKADPAAVATATRMLVPALVASREAARRARCVNNLKQIGLAMHNYHSANNCFPPAVVIGPDGTTPHSWRVALLPYLEAGNVYSQYKFDEPWDGPNNSKLIPLMPAVYRHPEDDREGITAYFLPIGPDTLFPDRKEGTGLTEITDGTSNTIMAVEARREVPWTKPEDIEYGTLVGQKEALPDLGSLHPGGFDALFGDGSVRFISSRVNLNVLRALFTKAGGEVISADAY